MRRSVFLGIVYLRMKVRTKGGDKRYERERGRRGGEGEVLSVVF